LLNRYISAFARTKLIAETSRLQPPDLLSPVFNGVEAAVKLYDVDPDRGLYALLQLKEGKTTLAAVRSKLVALHTDYDSLSRGWEMFPSSG
jgi:hypothetical protein